MTLANLLIKILSHKLEYNRIDQNIITDLGESTITRSANFPFSIDPWVLDRPMEWAELMVAAAKASSRLILWLTAARCIIKGWKMNLLFSDNCRKENCILKQTEFYKQDLLLNIWNLNQKLNLIMY